MFSCSQAAYIVGRAEAAVAAKVDLHVRPRLAAIAAPRTPDRPAAPKAAWAVPCSRQTVSTRSFSAQVMTRGRY